MQRCSRNATSPQGMHNDKFNSDSGVCNILQGAVCVHNEVDTYLVGSRNAACRQGHYNRLKVADNDGDEEHNTSQGNGCTQQHGGRGGAFLVPSPPRWSVRSALLLPAYP